MRQKRARKIQKLGGKPVGWWWRPMPPFPFCVLLISIFSTKQTGNFVTLPSPPLFFKEPLRGAPKHPGGTLNCYSAWGGLLAMSRYRYMLDLLLLCGRGVLPSIRLGRYIIMLFLLVLPPLALHLCSFCCNPSQLQPPAHQPDRPVAFLSLFYY